MPTPTTDITDVSSASPPAEEASEPVQSVSEEEAKMLYSFAVSSLSIFERTIVVKSPATESVKLPINVERERARYDDLLANRGPDKVTTSSD